MNENSNEPKSFDVPITIDFDHTKVVGRATVKLDEASRTLIGEGRYTLMPSFVVTDYEIKDDCVLFGDIELIEISIVPNYNPPLVKRKKKTSVNNNNNPDGI